VKMRLFDVRGWWATDPSMFRYVKPKFINPLLLEKHMPLLEVLQDEAAQDTRRRLLQVCSQ